MSKRPFKPKCFKCNEETEEAVAEVGKFGTQRGGKHPLKTLIGYVEKQGLPSLAAELKDNLKTKEPTFIHKSCRTKLRNQSRETKEEKLQKMLHRQEGNIYLILKHNVFIARSLASMTVNIPIEIDLKWLELRIQEFIKQLLNCVKLETIKWPKTFLSDY